MAFLYKRKTFLSISLTLVKEFGSILLFY